MKGTPDQKAQALELMIGGFTRDSLARRGRLPLLRQFLLLQPAKRNAGFGCPLLFAVGGSTHKELRGG